MSETTDVLRLISDSDWGGMIKWAKAHGCLPDRHWADDPREYEWVGDHSQDARHVYPMRGALIRAVASEALEREKPTP